MFVQNFKIGEVAERLIGAEWKDSSGALDEVANVISVHELNAPQVYVQMLRCSENLVFPLGLQPTSL